MPETAETLALMAVIDAAFLDMPWYGNRQMARHLQRLGHPVGRRRVRRPMAKMGLSPIFQRPRTSDPHPRHRIYPYLLRDLGITQPNQVRCADITYLPMRSGFLYLVAIMDWASRRVLAWRLSNTIDAELCVAALKDALAQFTLGALLGAATANIVDAPIGFEDRRSDREGFRPRVQEAMVLIFDKMPELGNAEGGAAVVHGAVPIFTRTAQQRRCRGTHAKL